jgi:hypothetical protein
MRTRSRVLIAGVVAPFLILFCDEALSIGDFGPDTCMEGFVWREACGPSDHVCVSPKTREDARADNRAAASRVSPTDRSSGPDTCKTGFVWREACGSSDHVCVSPQTRAQAVADNRARESRRKYPHCENYARDAVNANSVNANFRCGFSGNSWQSSQNAHFGWCLVAPDRDVDRERESRYKRLGKCSSRAESTARAGQSFPSGPQPAPGQHCCVQPGGTGPDGRPFPPVWGCGPQCP